MRDDFIETGTPKVFVSSHGGSRVKLSLWPFCGWILGPTKAIWARFDLQRKRCVRYFASRTGWLDTYKKNYRIKKAGLAFRRCIETTQNATRTATGKSRALKSGSNQMADVRTAVRVRGKLGDKCLVMRLRFAVMREFWF